MIYLSNTMDIQIPEKTAVTLGKFDGLHRGHQKLLAEIIHAKQQGFKSVVFTFASPPMALLTGKPQRLLMTNKEKELLLEQMQIDYLVEYPFNETIARLSPQEFVEQVLCGQLNAGYMAVGQDFGFGYRRAGNAELLKKMALDYSYQITVVKKEKDGARDISSTYIKEELNKGNMEKVAFLMGRPFSLIEEIVHGKRLGRVIGIPTINMIPEESKMLPPKGVYCAQIKLEGQCYNGIANIGVKPTVTENRQMTVETHLFDFHGDIYGKTAEVMLYSFVRSEQKFSSVEELKIQMQKDIAAGKDFFINKKLKKW